MAGTIRKILALFDRNERWELAALAAAIVIMALIQAVGVASIMPFMSLIATPGIVETDARMRWVYDGVGFASTEQFLFWAGVAVLGLLAFSNAFSAFTTWLQFRFVWRKHHRLSHLLLARYLDEDYSFFLQRNTAQLSKNILAEVDVVITGVLIPMMRMLAKGIVALFIVALLFAVDPVLAAVVLAVMGGTYGLMYLVLRRRQARLGRQRIEANTQRYKLAGEALGGIKDVKVLGREQEFVERFRRPSDQFARAAASNQIVSELPKYALETIAFGGIILVVLYHLRFGQSIQGVLPLLTLYAFAGYRLMPALQYVYLGLTKIKFNMPALEVLHNDLRARGVVPGEDGSPTRAVDATQSDDRLATSKVSFDREVRFREVSFRYPEAEESALGKIDLTIPKNHTVGLAGTTGSGKTTLVDILLGLHQPSSGAVLVDDLPLDRVTLPEWRSKVGYVPQSIFLCDDTVRRNIAFGIPEQQIDDEAVENASRVANLHGFVTTLSGGYSTVVGERGVRLSGGQRQRIGIARALYHDPDVLVLDEATSALDGITEDAVMEAINNLARSKTIVLIAHRITTLANCDWIFLLEEGQVVSRGTYQQLMSESIRFRAMARSAAETTGGMGG